MPGIAFGNLSQPQPPSSVSGILAALRGAAFGGPSWSDQASQLRALQQQHAPLEQRMALASGLLGGFGGSIRAFHGSPHVFDAFDAAKIGTGEGAQAYGHGLYFAEEPNVAAGYQKRLSQDAGNAAGEAQGWLRAAGGDRAKAMANVQENIDWVQKMDPDSDMLPIYQRAMQALQGEHEHGALYEVNLASDPEDLLHWDKPLSEQPAKVQEALGKLGVLPKQMTNEEIRNEIAARPLGHVAMRYVKGHNVAETIGSDLYRSLVAKTGSDEAASAALRDAGIPGIRYLDAGSRGPSEAPTHNIVMFDPSQAQIVSRNGIKMGPVPLDLSTEARMARAKFDPARASSPDAGRQVGAAGGIMLGTGLSGGANSSQPSGGSGADTLVGSGTNIHVSWPQALELARAGLQSAQSGSFSSGSTLPPQQQPAMTPEDMARYMQAMQAPQS